MASASKAILHSIHRFADDSELWCEECGKEVPANYYGIEIREMPIFICAGCAEEIGKRLIALAFGI